MKTIDRVIESLENAVPYSTTFLFLEEGCGAVGQETPLAKAIEAAMKKKFDIWADTWMRDQLKEIRAENQRLLAALISKAERAA